MLDHNVTYPIAPALIAAQIDTAIARLEGQRQHHRDMAAAAIASRAAAVARGQRNLPTRAPATPEEMDAITDQMIALQRDHYSTVRVVRLAGIADREKSHVLVYGDVDDATVTSGTGPFDSLGKAVEWFTNGGR